MWQEFLMLQDYSKAQLIVNAFYFNWQDISIPLKLFKWAFKSNKHGYPVMSGLDHIHKKINLKCLFSELRYERTPLKWLRLSSTAPIYLQDSEHILRSVQVRIVLPQVKKCWIPEWGEAQDPSWWLPSCQYHTCKHLSKDWHRPHPSKNSQSAHLSRAFQKEVWTNNNTRATH